MRVSSNLFTDQLLGDLTRLADQQATLNRQVASGKKLESASDNPAAAGRVLALESEKRVIRQYETNAGRAEQVLKVGSLGLQGLRDTLDRSYDLGTSALSSRSPESLATFRAQINGLIEHALAQANSKLNGDYVFAGTASAAAPFAVTRNGSGEITAVAYNGTTNASSEPEYFVGEGVRLSPYTSGAQNAEINDALNHLVALRDAVDPNTGTPAAILAAQTQLEGDDDRLLGSFGALTAVEYRVQVATDQNKNRFNALAELVDADTHADLAETILRLKQAETAYTAAISSGANILRTSLLDYIR